MASFYDRKNVDDYWVGTKRDDTMSGNGGHDVMFGMDGNDSLYGGDGNDQLFGGNGRDYLQGNSGNDLLAGGNGNDTLTGATGEDRLWGGDEGNTGGDGAADTFVFNYAADSRAGDGIDRIMDFHPEEGDRINIGATVEGYSYNQSYYWELVSDESQLTHTHQQITLTYDPQSGYTTLNLYFGDNDPDVDMTLLIWGQHLTDAGLMRLVG